MFLWNWNAVLKRISITACVQILLGGIILGSYSNAAIAGDLDLEKLASEMNAELPKQLNSQTIWQSTASGPGRKLTHFYVISVEAPLRDVRDHFSSQRHNLARSLCTDPLTRNILSYQIEIVYHYRTNDGSYIGENTVSLRDCN